MEADKDMIEVEEKVKSYAGIPEAEFVDDIDAYMTLETNSGEVDKVLKRLDEQHSKYKCMEYNLLSKKRRLRVQIPDLEMSLAMIKFLQKQNESPSDLEMEFLLSEQAYVKATIPPTDKVCLWLGANVMLEYTLDDASELLEKNIDSAKKNLSHVEHDLDFLRDQFTTTEVNMARVFNWDVKRRKTAKEAAS
ncbi:prefoldin subunit 3 [Bacillus rossius redtenbacheri]|uniref:prefoldin subunit 3 n=1 Tax=Bacillus rossius redtenbacheri TaxID=93214 RepID=UPI002FDCCFF8